MTETSSSELQRRVVNVGLRLSETARRDPDGIAVVEPCRQDGGYRQISFRELDEDSSRIAAGFSALGATPGARAVLLVKPGVDFISLVFALFKAGAVTVLIDPGMGRRHLIRCLRDVSPDGFVAIPQVHAARVLLRGYFPRARYNVTVGRRWFWGGPTLEQLRRRPLDAFLPAATQDEDLAAIIFTSGSTGPPKGVLYRHGNFDRQVDEIRDFYEIQPGETDLAGFPLFALFNAAMGVTTVVPEMDFSRPAKADPRKIVKAASDWRVTQAFGSPALWNVVGRHCEANRIQLPYLRRVLSAGAPVPPHVLRRMTNAIHPQGEVHTPYGATEALPVASINARQVLGETAAASEQGAGTCVGQRFPGIVWKVVRIRDGPLTSLGDVEELPRGEIGELMVHGPVVTREYATRREANALSKVAEDHAVWHRMGDVGYLDAEDRFWFCGRKSHRVTTRDGPLYTIPCEAIFNQHPRVYRSALVGVGLVDQQRPVIICELWPEHRITSRQDRKQLLAELLRLGQQHPVTRGIRDVLIHPELPVDIRHNAKISRERLAVWAARRIH